MSTNDLAEARVIQAMLDFRNARAVGDDASGALNRFENALDFMTDADRRTQLEEAMAELELAAAEDAFRRFGELADDFRQLKDGFVVGQQVAEAGEKDLFFPAVATHLGQVAAILQSLKDAAESVQANIEDLEASFGERDADSLITEAGDLRDSLETLIETFTEIKTTLAEG